MKETFTVWTCDACGEQRHVGKALKVASRKLWNAKECRYIAKGEAYEVKENGPDDWTEFLLLKRKYLLCLNCQKRTEELWQNPTPPPDPVKRRRFELEPIQDTPEEG